jgi:hypothetical protein
MGRRITELPLSERRKILSSVIEPGEHVALSQVSDRSAVASGSRDETGPHSGCVNEVLPTVEAHHEGIDAEMAWNVPANYELLPKVDPILAPESSSLTGLVDAV